MTPKNKAKELVKKFTLFLGIDKEGKECYFDKLEAIRCAIIEVNEILNMYIKFPKHPQSIYWKEVKAELEKIVTYRV